MLEGRCCLCVAALRDDFYLAGRWGRLQDASSPSPCHRRRRSEAGAASSPQGSAASRLFWSLLPLRGPRGAILWRPPAP